MARSLKVPFSGTTCWTGFEAQSRFINRRIVVRLRVEGFRAGAHFELWDIGLRLLTGTLSPMVVEQDRSVRRPA